MWIIIRMFGPKTAIFPTKYGFLGTHIGLAGSFGALLVGGSVIVARELYLARHLFTLFAYLLNVEIDILFRVCIGICVISFQID